MAKKKSTPITIPPNTIVELVGIKGKTTVKQELEYHRAVEKKLEFESDPKWKRWTFRLYQQGFSQFKNQ
jgi:hypothetical protein